MTLPASYFNTLYIAGPIPKQKELNLIVFGGHAPTNNLGLMIQGPKHSWADIKDKWGNLDRLYTDLWPAANGIESEELSLYSIGDTTIQTSGQISLFLNPEPTGFQNLSTDLYVAGPINKTDSFDIFLKTDPVPSDNIDLFIKGSSSDSVIPQGLANNDLSLFSKASSSISISNSINITVKTQATGQSNNTLPLSLVGLIPNPSLSVDLFIGNTYIGNSVNLFTAGYWTVHKPEDTIQALKGETDSKPTAGGPEISSRLFISQSNDSDLGRTGLTGPLFGYSAFNSNNFLIFKQGIKDGGVPITETMNMVVSSGTINVKSTDKFVLFMSGSLPWSDIDDSTDLFMFGSEGSNEITNIDLFTTASVLLSSNHTLYIHGSLPKDDGPGGVPGP